MTDDEIVTSLLQTGNIVKTAQLLGVSRATIHRRMKQDVFLDKLKEKRRDNWQIAQSRLTDALQTAVSTLCEILTDENISPGIRLRASIATLDLALKSQEQLDILETLQKIEQQLEK